MNLRSGLWITAILFATAAVADPAASPAPPAAASGKTVEGLIVVAPNLPAKACSPRDAHCIQLVVAELKRLYPEQLKRFCFQRQMRDIRSNILNETDPGQTPFVASFSAPAALKVACTTDKR